jgi:FkbM family methyltransferase
MISFSYNFEDVYIQRLFRGKTDGFYIDVGAAHPTEGSVTRHFYDLGWRGINIEPQDAYFKLLKAERPHDINLQIAVGAREEDRTFFDVGGQGGSTLDASNAKRGSALGFDVTARSIHLTTLMRVCEAHAHGPIDFLKIDVEGWEGDVIRGADWQRFRPLLVVVEATVPFSPEPCHQEWEPLLLEAGYGFAFFDGLNRYYLRLEDAQLAPVLAVPVNVFDEFITHGQYRAEEALKRSKLTYFFKNTSWYASLRQLERRLRHSRRSG